MRKILKVIDRMSTLGGYLVSPLPLLSGLLIVYEITMRQVFGRASMWVSELTAMFCGACFLLGGAWNVLRDGHVRVDIIYARFSPRVRAGVNCLNFGFLALYLGVMLRVIWPYVRQAVQLGERSYTFWNPYIWPMKIVLMAGFILVLLQAAAQFCRDLHFLFTGRAL